MSTGELRNGQVARVADVPRLPADGFRREVVDRVEAGARILSLFGQPGGDGAVVLTAALGRDHDGTLGLLQTEVKGSYPSLTPFCAQAHWFEREVAEQWAVVPEGHPWLKPIRFHPSYGNSQAQPPTIGVTDFFRVEGEEVHEVAVGPVHAGIIEPGHFRFQCHGERVLHLEISLGYQHRGVERALRGGPNKRTMPLVETMAGDTTVAHATAFCQGLEELAHARVPARATAIRGIALELERLANHTGDLGALAGDVGYLPTQSFCGRIRGDFLNMSALLCGSRMGRGLVRPGGVSFDLDGPMVADLLGRLSRAREDVKSAVELLWSTPSVMARFESTGTLDAATCCDLGVVGPPARAAGVEQDVRHDYPSGIFCFAQVPVSSVDTGDVFARAFVRWLEIQRSLSFIEEQVRGLPAGPVMVPVGSLTPDAVVVMLAEGWRGEVCHVLQTGPEGRLDHVKVVDPSFHNWFGLAMALRGQQISDFPLCNKSFNLSYCGHDL
jgi:Ni,Fe-hydrogenase III large subunit